MTVINLASLMLRVMRAQVQNDEEEDVLEDDSPLERVVVTPNVGTSNEVTQPSTRVPNLDSNEPAPWVRRLHNKEDVIGDVNEGVRLGVK
ncbi:hypothetical protein LWI29_015419 [Acer saccharum]|uniref:Uncharacterized protein n=1 Tax=Acer saccharum TaxID=4024 RepID=A0AA39SAX5_ACESA|nr:hypothetical protein LWI29_015419 [Acer saccharum]